MIAAIVLSISPTLYAQAKTTPRIVKVYFQGNSDLLPDFIAECKREFAKEGLSLELVESDARFQYNIVVAQESTLGSAAAAAIALNTEGRFVASVVRSGRFSGKGALNATAKELAKKLSVLAP